MKRKGELTEGVDSGVDVEERRSGRGRAVEVLVDGDRDEDGGWNENAEMLVGKLRRLVDKLEVENSWQNEKEVADGLIVLFVGGAVGPMLSSAMGVRAIDAGIPQLSMHSIRATTGALDPGLGVKIFAGFFDNFQAIDKEFE